MLNFSCSTGFGIDPKKEHNTIKALIFKTDLFKIKKLLYLEKLLLVVPQGLEP